MGRQFSVSQKHVLIIDPNTFAAESLAFLLHCNGHITKIAYSAGEGLSSAMDFLSDVVLFDIGLSEKNGINVATDIRSIPGLQNILIIALTSDSILRNSSHTAAINLRVVKSDEFSLLLDIIANSAQSIHSRGNAHIRRVNNNPKDIHGRTIKH